MPSERESTARAVIIAELASRPYWHRLWIVQECALATDLFILCGNSIAKASTLWHHKTVFNYTGEEAMWTVLGLKSGEMVSLSLQDAVIKFRDWPCFDPRDRIYDLAALIKWPSRRQIAIDYNTSSTDLCRQAMTYCNDSRGFDALLQTLGQRSEASLELAGIALCKSMQDFRTVCRLLSLTKTDDQDTIQAAMTFFRSIREIKDLEIVAQFKITIQERMKLAWEKLSLCSGGADVRTLVQTLDVAAAVDLAFIQAAMLRIERDWDRLKRAFLLSSSWVSDYDRLHLCTKLVHPAKSVSRSLNEAVRFILASGLNAEHPKLLEWARARSSQGIEATSSHSAPLIFQHHGYLCPVEDVDDGLQFDVPVYGPQFRLGCHCLKIKWSEKPYSATTDTDLSSVRHGKYDIGHIDPGVQANDFLCPVSQTTLDLAHPQEGPRNSLPHCRSSKNRYNDTAEASLVHNVGLAHRIDRNSHGALLHDGGVSASRYFQ